MARKSTRDMFLDVATRLFATIGLRRTTMETIASEAGRGRRTLYMYFGNKAEIYEAVVEREIRSITGPLRDIVSSGDDFEAILHLYARVRTDSLSALRNRNPLLLKDFAQGHARVEKLRERLNRDEIRILTPLFSKYLADSHKPNEAEPEDYAAIFLNILRGTDRLIVNENGLKEIRRITSVATSLLLRGIAGRNTA
jgi:AcrR family transcriptional regulator